MFVTVSAPFVRSNADRVARHSLIAGRSLWPSAAQLTASSETFEDVGAVRAALLLAKLVRVEDLAPQQQLEQDERKGMRIARWRENSQAPVYTGQAYAGTSPEASENLSSEWSP